MCLCKKEENNTTLPRVKGRGLFLGVLVGSGDDLLLTTTPPFCFCEETLTDMKNSSASCLNLPSQLHF